MMVVTFKCRMYESERNRHLHQQIDISALIWNHCLDMKIGSASIFNCATTMHVSLLCRSGTVS